MNRPTWQPYLNSPFNLIIFSGLLTVLLSAIFLRGGFSITPDGWGYWEGSVSLLSGEGYSRFGGQPIIALAPLFSIYLAGIQKMLGVSGWSLVLALILLAGLTSSAWVALLSSLSNRDATPPYQTLVISVYVSMFISFYYRHLFSETLFLLLLALLLISITQISRQKKRKLPLLGQICYLNLTLVLLLLSRNSALVFVPGVVVALWLALDHLNSFNRASLPLLTALLPLTAWSGSRQLLGQSASHPFQLGGHYTPLEYIEQILASLAAMLGPTTFDLGWGILFLCGLALVWLLYIRYSPALFRPFDREGEAQQRALHQAFGIILSGFGGLYLLFNLTFIHDLLAERFLWFLILGIIGLMAAYTTWLPTGWSRRFLTTIFLIVATLQSVRTLATAKIAIEEGFPLSEVPPHYTIRADYLAGSPIQGDSLTIVAPPDYEWVDRGYSEKHQ